MINHIKNDINKAFIQRICGGNDTFDLKLLLYGDSDIGHDRNAVIVQAAHYYIWNFERFQLCTLYYV